MCVNQGIIAMRSDSTLPPIYILNWARENMESIVACANGTTFPEISKRNFRPLPVLVPPERILLAFEVMAASLHRQVVANLEESESLAATRDALLPRLV